MRKSELIAELMKIPGDPEVFMEEWDRFRKECDVTPILSVREEPVCRFGNQRLWVISMFPPPARVK